MLMDTVDVHNWDGYDSKNVYSASRYKCRRVLMVDSYNAHSWLLRSFIRAKFWLVWIVHELILNNFIKVEKSLNQVEHFWQSFGVICCLFSLSLAYKSYRRNLSCYSEWTKYYSSVQGIYFLRVYQKITYRARWTRTSTPFRNISCLWTYRKWLVSRVFICILSHLSKP